MTQGGIVLIMSPLPCGSCCAIGLFCAVLLVYSSSNVRPIQHIKEVVFFILALTIRVTEHEAKEDSSSSTFWSVTYRAIELNIKDIMRNASIGLENKIFYYILLLMCLLENVKLL